MTQVTRRELFPGVWLRTVHTDKFKSSYLSLTMLVPLDRERAAANAAICARLLAMPCFQKAENLLLYAAFGGEVDLAGLAEQAARLGKTVAYPVCGENFTLTAAVPGPDGWELSLIHI